MTDPKRPYGGLVPSQPQGTRAYQDAAAYAQQLAKQQSITAQAQAAAQAAQNVYRNPYLTSQGSQQSPPSYSATQEASNTNFSTAQQQPYNAPNSQTSSNRGLHHQSSHGHLNINTNVPQIPGHANPGAGFGVPAHLSPTAPSNSYYTNARTRSNTINNMMDNIPPALARLQHMNQEVVGGRKALTPVLKRDDALREWERRQSGKAAAAAPYPQLEFLQQQAELAASQGMTTWGSSSSGRYPQPSSNLAHPYHPQISMTVDEDRRDAIMSNVRSAARTDSNNNGGSNNNLFGVPSSVIPSPPQAYSSNSTTTGNRYAATSFAQPQQQTPTSPFDPMDRRADMTSMYVPMQPDQYGPYSNNAASSQQHASRQVAPPAQAVPPSFYGAGTVQAGLNTQRNPFTGNDAIPAQGQGHANTKESRRKSGMDLWTQ